MGKSTRLGMFVGGLYSTLILGLIYLVLKVLNLTSPGLNPVRILTVIPMVFLFFIGTPVIFIVNYSRKFDINEIQGSIISVLIFVFVGGFIGYIFPKVIGVIRRK